MPVATGSTLVTITMGIVLVACLAARIAGTVPLTRTSTLSCTSSTTRSEDLLPLSLNVAILNQDVFPLDVTKISQPLPECLDLRPRIVGITKSGHISYPRDFRGLLRGGEMRQSQSNNVARRERKIFFFMAAYLIRRRQSKIENLKSLYLITLSARYSTDSGIVTPICFAVLRLITSSNFVGVSTGRSAGLAPFRILSTYTATRRRTSRSSAE